MPSTVLPLIAQAERHRARMALIDSRGEFTYQELLDASARVAGALLAGRKDLEEERVAFLIAPGFSWVAVQWGIWRAGGIAVPLPLGFPAAELEYFVDDTQSATIVFDSEARSLLAPIAAARGLRALSSEKMIGSGGPAPAEVAEVGTPSENPPCRPTAGRQGWGTLQLPAIDSARRAMIIYTSGTTSRPKGVVTTHDNLTAQITTLVDAWGWSADDRIVLCLPLHHVHGIMNVLSCALWSGAICEILPRFDAHAVWERIASGRVTVFMAVPTIYVKLISAWEASSPERRALLSQACARLRLMVSGSAALPVSTLERWKQISSHTLLERYGMTEIGMALSNPLHDRRVPGAVGTPLPGVQVRLVDESGAEVPPGSPGEIEVRAPSVFKEYWRKPEATRDAFRQGWFRTGDMAVVENGVYRILGRTSIDILKTGGYKLSALEIEEVLRGHPAISECAVVGVPDPEWGERVAAAVVLRDHMVLDLDGLRSWAKERLAAYKVPSRLLVLESLPRNAMGKVTKRAVVALFEHQ